MKCYFCWDSGDDVVLTKEHLLSRPVATAFRLDRSTSLLARFGDAAADDPVVTKLDGLAVRLACAACNSGWMNDLEHGMAGIASWQRAGDKALGASNVHVLSSWLLKTYIVLSVIEGGTRSFPSTDAAGFHVLPEITRGRQLRQRDQAAFDAVAIGLARTDGRNGFEYGFGNPTVTPSGPAYANARSAGVAAITLGSLQAWIVVPWFRHARCRLPAGVTRAHPQLRSGRLQTVPARPNTLAPVVDNGEHNIEQVMRDAAAVVEGTPARPQRVSPEGG